MSGGLINIIRLVIDLYATVILVRLLLQLVQADFFNPISQTIFKVTAPIVEPLHKIFPTFGKFNTAALAAAILVKWSFFIIWFGFQSALPSQLIPLLFFYQDVFLMIIF